MNIMSHIKLKQRQKDFAKGANCKLTAWQVLVWSNGSWVFPQANCLRNL